MYEVVLALEPLLQPLSSDSYLMFSAILFGLAIIGTIIIGLLDIAVYLLAIAAVVLFVIWVHSLVFAALVPVHPGLSELNVFLSTP